MYRVIEVAKILDVSKVTVYKKIRFLKEDIKPYVVKEKNVTYILNKGVEMIKETLHNNKMDMPIEPHLKIVQLETKQNELNKKLLRGNECYSQLQNDYIHNLQLTCDTLENIKKNKLDRLKTLKNAVDNTKNTLAEIKEQVELFVELDKQYS